MSRKDYKVIAECIKNLPDSATVGDVVDALCNVFARDNFRFDDSRFREACGL